MIIKTRNFARWARKSGLSDSLLKMAIIELGLTTAQIAVALEEGALVEVEYEA